MKSTKFVCTVFVALTIISCHKGFLDVKPDKAQVVPASLKDLQAMLDNTSVMNEMSGILAIIGADEYYYTDDEWRVVSDPTYRNGYLWEKAVFEGRESMDWNYAYQKILYANIVLQEAEHLPDDPHDNSLRGNVIGSALFHRSFAFYQLLQLFAAPYNKNTTLNDLGIPLKLTPNIEEMPGRASVSACYEKVVLDLMLAIELLPEYPTVKERASTYAAKALLARVYLDMQLYEPALRLCEEIISKYTLINYNNLDSNAELSFPARGIGNSEVIFQAMIRYNSPLTYSISNQLIALYGEGDTRKALFFGEIRSKRVFSGSYVGTHAPFGGLAVDEIYLIAIECLHILGDTQRAISMMQTLNKHRYKPSNEPEIIESNLMSYLVDERRRQLLFRGLRWSDLRRYNGITGLKTVLEREVGDTRYTLSPNSPRYIWPIPESAIRLGGLQQNDRE